MTIETVRNELTSYAALEAELSVLERALTLDTGKPIDAFEIRIIGKNASDVQVTATVDARAFTASILSAISTRKTAVESDMTTIESHY